MKHPVFCMFMHEYAEYAMLFPGFQNGYSGFRQQFSTFNIFN